MKSQVPELACMDPENYKKYFRTLCWSGNRKVEKKSSKKFGKKEKLRRLKSGNALAACYAPALLGNPSQFAVYATVRKAVLQRWRQLQGHCTDMSDDSDNEDSATQPLAKLPKMTGIGLQTVFALVAGSRATVPELCAAALSALRDVLQGLAPEGLQLEPPEIVSNLHDMLVEVSSGPEASKLTAVGSSALVALAVARGEAPLILSAVASLVMCSPQLSDQYIQIPLNLTTLQRSVQSVLLGGGTRAQWMHHGVPAAALSGSFPVELGAALSGELVVRSLVSDGCYLYVFTSRGLLKIGSGYGGSIRQHLYLYKHDFFAGDRHGWLGYCKNKLYVRIGRKKTDLYVVDKDSLAVRNMIRLDPGFPAPIEPKSAVFTDGNQLGLILLTNPDSLTIRIYDPEETTEKNEGSTTNTVTSRKEISVHLLRRRILALGRAPFEDGLCRRASDLDAPVAMQLDDNDDDPLVSICAGQDFGLLTTASGKVYYTGKGSSLGYKGAAPHTGRWTLMKETLFCRNDTPNVKKCKVIQVAVGHEGVHAILVLDNGAALFTGVARRGEDGDANKHRRTPKPTRPKNIFKAEGQHIVHAACNYGSTALVTRAGALLMFGKDTQHADATGLVHGMRQERVVQVALGKAHAVALTNIGHVFTFGLNNKGQCGREFGYTKERTYASRRGSATREEPRLCEGSHAWCTEYCRVCVLCRQCTGFSASCHCAQMPDRLPGERCGCGEGDSGCSVCGVCRRCADAARPEPDDDGECSLRSDTRSVSDKEKSKYPLYEGHQSSETEREASLKVSCLPPARVAVPGGHRVVSVACGLHHTVLLTEHGDVLTFGSNQYGQLGAGDVSAHHRIIRVRIPRAAAVAAGSNHTAVLTRDGELYTFGSYQKGALGRPRIEDSGRTERSPIWYAMPGRVPRLGPRHASKAVAVSASGDQTFVQISQALIKTDTLFSSTITADSTSIVILPNRPEHTFKCITIAKSDGTCNAWTGTEQVDFVNTLACLDPLYDVLWCYQPQQRVMKSYNILAFDHHNLQRCCNDDTEIDGDIEYPHYGIMKRLEDFKNLENLEVVCNREENSEENVTTSDMSILNQELAIPSAPGCLITRIHAALHLLGCLESLTYAHDNKLYQVECKRDHVSSPVAPVKEDFLTVNRFESHGGGWGYSGHSVEAIRFMCDTDILLGGVGLFGGRGDYTAKVKVFDIGLDGGEQEGDGELIAESDEVVYECPPRDRFPVLLDAPVPLQVLCYSLLHKQQNFNANRWYVAAASINGPSSDCGSSGQAVVISDDVGFHFKTSKRSNNGTDVNAGQIPCLLYNVVTCDQTTPAKTTDPSEPVIVLSKNISRKVSVACFRSLITLLQWSWNTFKDTVLDTNGQIPINYQKLTLMKHQKRLVYVIRACLRLIKSYINEIYPQNNKKKNCQEYMAYFEAIAEVRNLIQSIMADPTPTCTMLPRKPGKNKAHRACYVQLALELTNSILTEAHDTFTACFHAFFPTPTLKWNHLCFLLYHVMDGLVGVTQSRELSATAAAMCGAKSLRYVLHYVVPLTQQAVSVSDAKRPDSKVIKEVPSKSATVPRSSHSQKPPPVPPRINSRDASKNSEVESERVSHTDWHLVDAVRVLTEVGVWGLQGERGAAPSGSHEHGERAQQQRLAELACKLAARVVAELVHAATTMPEEQECNTVVQLVTPLRFMRVNGARAWNTGNGSPDAVAFSVDRAVLLLGAQVYAGFGNYQYSLELLHDARQVHPTAEESNTAHCWVSLEMTHGTLSASDTQHDTHQIKFDRPVPLKEEQRYALRFCNHGGRTANGDCGLPSVKGPDGTTFRFSSCSLSFNGTTLARGQIPSLIYYSTMKCESSSAGWESVGAAARALALRVAALVVERGAELLGALRTERSLDEIRRLAPSLHQHPALHTLLPYTLASLEALDDPKSVVMVLELVHGLLGHVAALNLALGGGEEGGGAAQYHAVAQSDHPYKQAAVTNLRVLFPATVAWVVLEMDPRSVTAQPEDTLTVFATAGAPRSACRAHRVSAQQSSSFRKRLVQLTDSGEVEELGDDGDNDTPCTHYNCTYVSITPKLANIACEWPQKALLVPGNEVVFSLETASDYLNDYNNASSEESRWGFRCVCSGYEDASLTWRRRALAALEMELVHWGAAGAARLLAPDLSIPPLAFSTIVEVQVLAMMGASDSGTGAGAGEDAGEELLLARGLHLDAPPTVHQVLDAQPLRRCMSAERQFLLDFVSGAGDTAGGRLARWLAPAPRVEPARCELHAPTSPPRPSRPTTIPVLVRDQYGDLVASPALKLEVMVKSKVERADLLGVSKGTGTPTQSMKHSILFYTGFRSEGVRKPLLGMDHGPLGGRQKVVVQRVEEGGSGGCARLPERRSSLPDLPYQPTLRDTMRFHAITMMKAYQNYSFEELRLGSGAAGVGRGGAGAGADARVPAERLSVRAHPDGACVAVWTPRAPGLYMLRCTLDDQLAPQELSVEVVESRRESDSDAVRDERSPAPASPPAKLRRFPGRHSAGLRVRASPSLQAEQLATVPPGSHLAIVEEVENKDGTWVRLGAESARQWAPGWCLLHHRHLKRTLLQPVSEYPGLWRGGFDSQTELRTWSENTLDIGANDLTIDDKRYPFSTQCEIGDELDRSFIFGMQPSKRGRMIRNEANVSPRRIQRKSNGNSEEWWSPVKHRPSDNTKQVNAVLETAVEESVGGHAQAGTQTSPERAQDDNAPFYTSPNNQSCEALAPPIPARAPPPAPPPAPPRKRALSVAQAEALRAVFCALLWHEGIVHDAIACAAFLKFHPQLPKQGARVLTRAGGDLASKPQRHSVEVSNAGHYLRIHPSTLESLTRAGEEASASRARKHNLDGVIKEEDAHVGETGVSGGVMNVLPPALRALVALWDALCDADQMTPATDKVRKDSSERNENDESNFAGMRKKRDWKNSSTSKTPYSVGCELCGGRGVSPPLAAHMRHAHPGCHARAAAGYDRAGRYSPAHPPAVCGELAQAYQLWYIYCEKCREKALKAVSAVKQPKTKSISELERNEAEVDHVTMKENALFLLDLAPLNCSESSVSTSAWQDASRSPPTPASMWLPAPAFQCLSALGAAPPPPPQDNKYHSLGRAPLLCNVNNYVADPQPASLARVPRSVSMGQAGAGDLARAADPHPACFQLPQSSLPGAGSMLLTAPSAALLRVADAVAGAAGGLPASPAVAFVLARRDLHAHRQKMDAAVRINTLRQYAFEALNWLLRSCTLATCAHDVMWWFCGALDKYARVVPPPAPPPLLHIDNKETMGVSGARSATASLAALCGGGVAARAALHALLGSVAALAPALPPHAAALLQAVRCWALHYSHHDTAFLHRSQVFSVISRILSHAEDTHEETMNESMHSFINKEQQAVWACRDVTAWCDVTVSSRQGMAGALTDLTTETFWESGDEDRNKPKWIQILYPGGTPEDRPHIVCIHIDNTRDTVNKTLLVSFLYGCGSSELVHMQDVEVDPKAATWLCYTLPKYRLAPVRIRCELRGPEACVRVRQTRVLAAPVPAPTVPARHPLRALCEADTLRVFRLLTAQVFGKLLEWERCTSETEGEAGGVAGGGAPPDDADLREHVVGILFAGHKLTSLQRQVMSHIVCAIGCEAARARDDWESALLTGAEGDGEGETRPPALPATTDNYCFEMLSLLLALSGSAVGRAHLAQRTELLADLLSLLHTGSERVQRQVISLLRRMIAEIPPQKMLAAINYGTDVSNRVSLLDHLVAYLGKAISVQVKVKGGGGLAPDASAPAQEAPWFMRGTTTIKHAQLIAKLLTDMAEDKVNGAWGAETRTTLAAYLVALARTPERSPRLTPSLRMALAALAVCDHSLQLIKRSGGSDVGDDGQSARWCANHEDGCTRAVVDCQTCGPLCAECDRFLHLKRAKRSHRRQICKEEESAIRIDIHEGCGRAKLFWLLLLVDRRTLKALVEFRGMEAGIESAGDPGALGPPGLAGVCRFCGARGNTGLLAIGNVCADQQCQEHGLEACNRVLSCGHVCGGVRGERSCLPCLQGCEGGGCGESGAEGEQRLRQDADDMCMICFTDPLQAAPAIQLKCGHVFHLHCCRKVLANKWNGPRITFSFSQCPICKEDMEHWALEEQLSEVRLLRAEVRRKALMRLRYEGGGAGAQGGVDPAQHAMERYAYYVCHKCGKAYFGGLARCEAEGSGAWEPSELVCGGCSDVAGARGCPKHGADFLEYKCRYCCSVAVFFCFGTSHFCNACHDDFQRVTNIPKHLLPQCPAGPKGEQLPGSSEECPLHVQHPPTGEEFALGCGVCRHAHAF